MRARDRLHVPVSIKPRQLHCTGIVGLSVTSENVLHGIFRGALLAALCGTGLQAWAEHSNDGGLRPFVAEYVLYAKNTQAARVTRSLTRLDDGTYEYRSETKTVGLISLFRKLHIIEASRLVLADDTLKPLSYRYNRTGHRKQRAVSIEFDGDAGKIKNTINGDVWYLPLEPGVLDKLLYQLTIMHDLQHGRTPAAYQIADGGRIKTYHFEKLGEEVVATPLGSFNTIKMLRHRPDNDRKSTFWCAPELDYLQVKVEHTEKNGSTTVAVIKSLRW